ncbi:hypothetical protein [Clostridium perfringens]|uniref:hypothetical protein n=1 Tax=Clostridium perfringens TaxID=1502 RepID=UPI00232F10B4|nr:hypothetical protein [Clostridium perfringens]MDB2060225.1 hypothetical protein [Clostridium perfringens]MDB2062087.1 hypothetical protein [Clostridium perfringens]MDB2064917.1 hypothetical protein [Clostridium perfringens]MDK0839092.1 hypothetical protein [Clostridium perfringens]
MKFRYRNEDEMKDSGVECIGKIPSAWIINPIKYLVDKNEYYPIGDGDHGSIKPEMYQHEGIPYIRVQNLSWGNDLDFNGMVYISEKVNNDNKKSILKPKDILIAKTGATVGKTAIIPENMPQANTTSSVGKVTVDHNNINYKYVAYYFQSISFITQIKLTAYQKSAQPGFNIDDLIEYKVSLPKDIRIQNKIAKFLDEKTAEFDSIISKKEALIKKLEEAKKSLISEVVTGKVKVVKTSDGYELVQRKKEEMKNSGVEWLGEIPKEWKTTKLKLKTIQVNRGKSPEYVEESKIKVINQACIYWDCFNLKNVKYQNEINLGERGKLYKNDILINSTGTGTLGRANIFKEDGNFIADSHVTIIRCKDKSFADYLKYVFRTDLYQGLIYSTMVTGSTNQIELSREGLRNMIVLDISNEELNLINNILEDKINKINLVIDKTKSEIEKLKEAKQSLISEAVTGKIEILE